MIEFGPFNDMPITAFYSSRKASVYGIALTLTKKQKNDIREYLENNGYKMDNHICWSSDELHFMYSDECLFIGTEIYIQSW